MDGCMDGRMDDWRFCVHFNSISVISDDGRMIIGKAVCNGIPFTVEKISSRAGLEPEIARSVGQRLTN